MFTIEHHTADVRVRVESESVETLFRDSLAALMDVLGGEASPDRTPARAIAVEAHDRTALLVDVLNEALGLALVHGERYESLRIDHLDETSLRGAVEGVGAAFAHEVKAVTYHEAEVVQSEGRWSTTLVFDI